MPQHFTHTRAASSWVRSAAHGTRVASQPRAKCAARPILLLQGGPQRVLRPPTIPTHHAHQVHYCHPVARVVE